MEVRIKFCKMNLTICCLLQLNLQFYFFVSIENELDVTFEDILVFVTGADAVPPLGFQRKCEIQFYEQETGVKRIPYSSTCALILYLPRGVTEEEVFKDLMQLAMKESFGFGKV